MKKIIFAIVIVVLVVLFLAPWMGEDGGEDIINATVQIPEIREELDTLADQFGCNITVGDVCCDGLSSSWAPFGRYVEYCDYASWYVPFWGS